MRQMDLMPQKCREVLGRRVWLRRWAMVYALAIALLSSGVWFADARASSATKLRNDLAEVREVRWQQNEEAQALHHEIQDLKQRIERYNRLAWPVRVSEVIDTIASVIPEGVTLLSLTATERVETPERAGAKGKKDKPRDRSILITEIEGVARDDAPVASIVSGLQRIPLFRSVVLDYARNTEVDGIEARTFLITCETDLSKKYRFTEVAGVSDDR